MSDHPAMPVFPAGFVLGAATAAYQIEGAVHQDGRGPSIWDTFCHTPGNVADGTNADVACDHYHRYGEDLDLLSALHLNAYRFSVAWPRVIPHGRGHVNPAGLGFYDRLVDGLLARGIEPYLTLYHWDLPQQLQDEGGWLRRGIVEDFAAYAEVVAGALGDRVKHWTTLNEPWVFSWEGHHAGADAPGLRLGAWGALTTTHHALLSHGAAVDRLRAIVPTARLGIVLDMNPVTAASDHPDDVAAARRFDGCQNRWYLDALLRGHYPEDMLEIYARDLPTMIEGDMATIRRPLDYLGVNYYRRSIMAAGRDWSPVDVRRVSPAGSRYTAMGWEVSPHGLYDILRYVHDGYSVPALYVTENGAAFEDTVGPDGAVRDPDRVAYYRAHLQQVRRAIADGIPVHGYFAWTLLDNFEWAEGTTKRFGIVHTDFATQTRTIKDSGRFLARVAARIGGGVDAAIGADVGVDAVGTDRRAPPASASFVEATSVRNETG